MKSLVVKNHSENTRVLTVAADKAGVITGADIQTDSDVEIINKDHVLATLTADTSFMMEMVVENVAATFLERSIVPAIMKLASFLWMQFTVPWSEFDIQWKKLGSAKRLTMIGWS